MSESGKHWLRLAFSFAMLGGLLFLLRDKWHELPAAFARASPAAVLSSAVLNVLASIVLPALMTQLALKTERVKLPFWDLVRMNFVLRFYSLVLPKGGVLALRWNMYRRGGKGGDVFALVLFEKFTMVFAYLLPAVVCLALELPKLGAVGGPLMIIVAAMTLFFLATLLPFFDGRFLAPFKWLLEKAEKWLPKALWTRANNIVESIGAYHDLTARRIIEISAAQVTGSVLFVLSAYVLAVGMDLGVTLVAVGWMRTLTFVLTLAPITVGGVGIREISYIAFMRLYGVDEATALVYGLLLFAIQVTLGMIGFALDVLQRKQSSNAASS